MPWAAGPGIFSHGPACGGTVRLAAPHFIRHPVEMVLGGFAITDCPHTDPWTSARNFTWTPGMWFITSRTSSGTVA